MKRIVTFSIIVCGFLVACKQDSNTTLAEIQIEEKLEKTSFDWLIGNWTRLNTTPGKETFESWEKLSPESYAGFSFTLENQDTVFWEKIALEKAKDDWVYKVRMKDGGGVDFKLFEIETQSFKCGNKKNDFPKVIEYMLKDEQLMATISADSTKVPFIFDRIE